ncbi:hypothetical protein [Sulfuritortus calidifontis]|uniref:hypothetical protein n=1 Tax=Sulfuritortus calidifontis TaxID=1914471 RepID=UPI001404E2A2|nr:hypothetical protein [Sulfuritortus calidifontis]
MSMASCREAEGRRKLSERSEFFRRLHDGSGAGVSAEAGRPSFGYFSWSRKKSNPLPGGPGQRHCPPAQPTLSRMLTKRKFFHPTTKTNPPSNQPLALPHSTSLCYHAAMTLYRADFFGFYFYPMPMAAGRK